MLIYLQYPNKIFLFLLVLISFTFAQNEVKTGILSIKLNSPGYIYLDSEYLSHESVEKMILKTGEYQVSVYNSNSRSWNDRGYEKTITIFPDQKTDLVVENTNLYYFNSNPYNSNIIQNNKVIGQTPTFINSKDINLPEKLVISKNGYIDKNIFVSPNQYEYFFNLKPETIKSEINIASTGLENSQTKWFKEGFVVVSVFSSWAAFYFKRKADKYYDKYLQEGNPVKMNNYFNKTERFDTYSDVSIAVSLTSLGTYMYFLIFD